jgi:hypothetical protein
METVSINRQKFQDDSYYRIEIKGAGKGLIRGRIGCARLTNLSEVNKKMS